MARILISAVLLVACIALPAQAQDLRQDGTRAAIAAAVVDAQHVLSPCREVPSGPCVKLPPTGVDIFVTTAIVADNVCAFYDIVSTLTGTVTGQLRELNEFLAPFASNWFAMTTTRASVQVVKWWIFRSMKNKGPTWAKWTGITATTTAAMGCGAAIHNTLEMNR